MGQSCCKPPPIPLYLSDVQQELCQVRGKIRRLCLSPGLVRVVPLNTGLLLEVWRSGYPFLSFCEEPTPSQGMH